MSSNAASGELDNGWERALELAWGSFCAHTTPVGAVVLNSSDVIVAEGRGRRYEKTGPPRQLASTHVAHAELNALAQLGADRHYQDHVLAAQQAGLPAQVDLAGRPRTLWLFADAASSRTSLAGLRSALRGAI